MNKLLSLANGAVTITEEAGVVSINVNEALGGGEAAGIVSGTATIKLNAAQGLQLAEKLLNAHLPAALLPGALLVEGVANAAIKAAE